MENSWQEFIKALSMDDETEYGDFKREVDFQLHRLVESLPPVSEEQARALVKIREDYLWTDHPDDEIESIKQKLSQRIREIARMPTTH